ncbi:MAG TPA: hypothetical protein VLF91_04220 [Candidatus Saccharimonadales bacterium]|nr:hypothetical protein [Candidatus Saccharimonadales bacterium]
MAIKGTVGRPPKVNFKVIYKLTDSISHNYTISDACKYAGVSRVTFYRHLNGSEMFAKEITAAKENQNQVSFNFVTLR